MTNRHNRWLKIVSYVCPKKGCPYVFMPGMNVGTTPKGLRYEAKDRTGKTTLKSTIFCPTHTVGLVRRAERVKVDRKK